MAEPFIGEIRLFSFGFAPQNWATCDGQTLGVSQNAALFSLIGSLYGGNGTSNFCLPDMRGRVMMHRAESAQQGVAYAGGAESVAISLPAHQHTLKAQASTGSVNVASSNVLAQSTYKSYMAAAPTTTLNANAVASTGAGVAPPNMQPSLVVNYCIAIYGIYPTFG